MSRKTGPRPLPTKLRVLRGNASKRPLPTNEPKPPALDALPPPPAHLSEAAQSCWRLDGEELRVAGLLTKLDLRMLESLAWWYGEWMDAIDKLKSAGRLYQAKHVDKDGNVVGGYVQISPLKTMADKARKEYDKVLTEFGMSPSSRTRVQPAEGSGAGDEFDQLFGGGSKGRA